jgi:2-dehydro-3-deoxyphosphogluconate aldolase/(4S)-4-hydroxy-2-oxoglutarate aldolase
MEKRPEERFRSQVVQHIVQHKLIAIIRGLTTVQVFDAAKVLYEGGVRTMEVTLNSPDALQSIERLRVFWGEQMRIGAGTVVTEQDVSEAVKAGAEFLISPTFRRGVVQKTLESGCISIPGAYSPTEILEAWDSGAHLVKLFPASAGLGFVKDIRGPLPHIPLVPTGGITADNAASFLKAGAVALGIGSALVSSEELKEANGLEKLYQKTLEFVKQVEPYCS